MQQQPHPSDPDILEAVRQRLAEDMQVDATRVDIVVADGAVTLSGIVPTTDQVTRVANDVRQVPGVRSVESNQLGLPPEYHFEGETLPANTVETVDIKPGMRVVGVQGGHIGKVKSIEGTEFLVDRHLHRDLYVPLSAVLRVANEYESYEGGPVQPFDVVLSVKASDIDHQGWRHP
jgi:hypothetical protein